MTVATNANGSELLLTSLLDENSDKLLTCVHCGLCLPACPTYRQLGDENDSPRGRIYLMRGLVEGKLGRSESFVNHIDLCLGCRACETACPSGVPYGELLEAARYEAARAETRANSGTSLATRFLLNQVFTRPLLLRICLLAARWLRDSGIVRMAIETGAVSGRLRTALALLLSSASPLGSSRAIANSVAPRKAGSNSIRTALLRGCVMEGLFAPANRATERVLVRNGVELVRVNEQVCCGALHAHAGEIETARKLARKNIEAFSSSRCERIIVNSAGCGAAMKEYKHLLSKDDAYAERAREFSSKVQDLSEFLVERGIEQPGNQIARRIVYDAPCHLIHAQRIARAPIELLLGIPGVEVVPLNGFEDCCGGAGIYNLLHPDLANRILSEKIDNIRTSGADTVTTPNPGCIMQIGMGLLLSGIPVEIVHPIEILDRAYGN